jgi:hypothetical protein
MKSSCIALLFLGLSAVFADNLRVESKGNSKPSKPKPSDDDKPKPKKGDISEEEVLKALADWGNGLVSIAQASAANRVSVATNVINAAYNYQEGIVLFKPTLASVVPFRTTFESALSYFIGGNPAYAEDGSGFATNPWKSVAFEVDGRILPGKVAVVMGYKLLTKTDDTVTTAHFSMVFVRDEETGDPKIIQHHSSLPYSA